MTIAAQGNNQNNNKNFILVMTTLSAITGAFLMSMMPIALPAISSSFSASAVTLGWLVNSSILATAVLLIPFGKIADSRGRIKFYLYGSLFQALTSFMAVFSPDINWLIAARILQGIAGAANIVSYPAILISAFPPGERGKVLGINIAAVYAGISLSPFLGGLLTQHFGWQSIFIFLGTTISAITILLFWKIKKKEAKSVKQPFDFTGSIIFGLSLCAIIYGLTELPAIIGIVVLIIGLAGIGLFVLWETKTKIPMIDMKLFRYNNVFAFSNLAALINYCATAAVAFLLSLYLQYIKGFTPEVAGLVLVVQPAIQAFTSPVAGRLSDKLEPRFLASIGMALTGLGLAVLIFLSDNTPMYLIFISLVILGFGFGIFSSPNTNAIMGAVDKGMYSSANAVVSTSRTIGQMLSMAIVTLLFTIYIGDQQITAEYYPQFIKSTQVAFVVFTVLCFAGIFASLARGKAHHS